MCKKEMPLISIIIPTYNRANSILNTISSVLKQTYQNFEIVIVDDFSSDFETLSDVIKNLEDERIRLLRHNKNRHGSAARNTGIKAAKGEFIALLDSDDVWYPEKLEVCVNTGVTGKKVLYSKLLNKDGIFPSRGIYRDESVGDYLFQNNGSMQTSTIYLRSEFAKSVLFDESLVRFQDYDFVARLGSEGANFHFIPNVLVEMIDLGDGQRISNNVNYEPALYWLEKIQNVISNKAAVAFYYKRVVRLLVLSEKQRFIFSLMPQGIRENLSLYQKIKLRLISWTPSYVFKLLRTLWKLIKK